MAAGSSQRVSTSVSELLCGVQARATPLTVWFTVITQDDSDDAFMHILPNRTCPIRTLPTIAAHPQHKTNDCFSTPLFGRLAKHVYL